GLYLILLPYWFPVLVNQFASANLFIRAAVSLTAIVPSGVLMGFGFPMGMEIVTAIDSRPTPWFCAVNGAAGVPRGGSSRACKHPRRHKHDTLVRSHLLSAARPDCSHSGTTPP